MSSDRIDRFLKRRIMSAEGHWLLFCRLCGEYKNENEFYNSKGTPFGKTYKCKDHYIKSSEPIDSEFDYLKMNAITDKDFEQTEIVLNNLGYKTGANELPIWRQFEIKHKLKN
jgi:hypothetical protein